MSSDRIMAEEPIEKKITRILIHRKMTVTAAESCTGGLVAGTLVNADGISEVFKESYVTYSNEAKHKLLGVKKETLEKYGAVSRQTAAEMAEGAVRAAGADASVVTTGVAGPGGGTEEKPVGLVYIGCCVKGRTIVKRCFYGALMVIPRGPDLGAQVVLKRKWEKKHWQEYYDRGGKTL